MFHPSHHVGNRRKGPARSCKGGVGPAIWLQKVQLLEKKTETKNGVKQRLTDATKSSFGYKTRLSWRLKNESDSSKN